jgi:DNA mismatch endonuclease (patch repair protein)
MTDKISKERRSANMRAVKGRDTGPEKVVRSIARRLGYRFRLYSPTLPGRPDLLFPSRRAAIFVHGCFWHSHSCKRGTLRPKTNRAFWKKKLGRNATRDKEQLTQLKDQGWRTLVVWECQTKNERRLAARLRRFLGRVAAPL